MAARKKAKRKAKKKRASRRPRAKAALSSAELAVRVAEQMAGMVELGVKKMLAKLPKRGATAAAKAKLDDAIETLRRQALSFRDQAQALEERGAEGPAAVWRPLADRVERAAKDLARRLGS